MKFLIPLLLFAFTWSDSVAQTSNDSIAIINTAFGYIEGFYEGDTSKIKQNLSPQLSKYGYWNDENSNKWNGYAMSYQGAIDFAKNVVKNNEYPDEGAIKKVEILDFMSHIACVKVNAWWGSDYILMSKQSGKWMIEKVLWQGPSK
jgi:hypothetical protein